MIVLIPNAKQTQVSTQQGEGDCWDSTLVVAPLGAKPGLAEGSWICNACS